MDTGESIDQALDREVISTRLFHASRDTMFEAFSDPRRLAHWWGPKGFTNTFHEFDLRPGGRWHFEMHGPNGDRYEMEKEFIEVVRPERIVLRHPDPVHEFLMTMTFAEEAAGTRLTWHMRFESASECARVKPFILVANEENFDRLEAHLAGMTGVASESV